MRNTESKKIIWLASYPKSGNTWFRAFLTAINNNGEVDINGMTTDGMFSSRRILDDNTDLNSTLLTDDETKILLPEAYAQLPFQTNKEKLFFKIHDAYTLNRFNKPIVPSESTHSAIYIVRNPLSIAASLANHNSSTIDEAIQFMNNKKAALVPQIDNINIITQTRQLLLDWSGHVNSWLKIKKFPVHLIRYEDLNSNPVKFFTLALKNAGIVHFSKREIIDAIEACKFERLKNQEISSGFKEKALKSESFFRNGKADSWKKELNGEQIKTILLNHSEMMTSLKYIPLM